MWVRGGKQSARCTFPNKIESPLDNTYVLEAAFPIEMLEQNLFYGRVSLFPWLIASSDLAEVYSNFITVYSSGHE